VTSWRVASQRYQRNSVEDGHTFFFGLDDRHVIDGARGGNFARWLNHCCEPNCEAEQEGRRVFIRALADIMAGEELFIDYLLDLKGRQLLSKSCMRVDAARCIAEERCSLRGRSDTASCCPSGPIPVPMRDCEPRLGKGLTRFHAETRRQKTVLMR
jgi:SET domain-containing protein